jgi:hypothetical protein
MASYYYRVDENSNKHPQSPHKWLSWCTTIIACTIHIHIPSATTTAFTPADLLIALVKLAHRACRIGPKYIRRLANWRRQTKIHAVDIWPDCHLKGAFSQMFQVGYLRHIHNHIAKRLILYSGPKWQARYLLANN